MSTEYKYDPPHRPIVGGYSATFRPFFREIGKSAAIAATNRILLRETYEPTGDVAFDLRASAFRDVFIKGTREAFKESHEGFMSVGL